MTLPSFVFGVSLTAASFKKCETYFTLSVTALFHSLLETAKLCDLEPRDYLAQAARQAIADPGSVLLDSRSRQIPTARACGVITPATPPVT